MTNTAQSVRILLADDEDIVRTGLAKWLRKVHGFEVDAAKSGGQALQKIKKAPSDHYALVLLDQLYNEGPNGLDVLRELKAVRPALPVIMLTGKEPGIGASSVQAGAFNYIIKPFPNEELAAMIHAALQKRDSRLTQLCNVVAEILDVPLCIAWLLNETRDHFAVRAWSGSLDDEYAQNVTLDYQSEIVRGFVKSGVPAYLSNVTNKINATRYHHIDEAQKRKWQSLLTVPMIAQGRVVGILDAYSIQKTKRFGPRARILFQALAEQAATIVYEDQLVRRARALAEISRSLSGTYDVASILEAILGQVLPLIGTDIGWLYLLDREKEVLKISVHRGLELSGVDPERKWGEGVAGWVAQHGETQLIQDVTKDKRYFAGQGTDIRSEIVVPLKYEYTTLGVLVARSRRLNAFSEDDLTTLVDFAAQAALAVERDKLNKHMQRFSQLASADDLDSLLKYVVTAVYDLTGLPVALWRINPTDETNLRIQAHRKLRPEYVQDRVLDSRSLVAEVIRTRTDIEVSNIATDLRITERTKAEAGQQGWKSLLVFPITAGAGQVVGVLSLYTFVERRFTPREHELLKMLLPLAGAAIQNAERLQMVQRLSRSGRKLNNLQISPDTLKQKLQQIADEAIAILGADIVDLYRYEPDADDFILPPIMAGNRRHPEYVTNSKSFSKEDVVWQIIQSELPLYISNAQADSVLNKTWEIGHDDRPQQRFVFREGIASLATIRLVISEGTRQIPVGVLFVNYRRPRNFDEVGLKDMIETFAGEAAVALQNARLVQREQQHISGHRTLNEIAAQLTDTLDETKILETIASTTASAVDGMYCTVFRLRGDDLVLEVVYGKEGRKPGRIFKLGQGLAGWAAKERKSALVADTSKDPRYEHGWSSDDPVSLIVAPILLGDQVYGVISVELNRIAAFDEHTQTLLEILAAQAAIAIKNARLFASEKTRSRQLEQLHLVLDKVEQSRDLRETLLVLVEGVNNLFGKTASSVINLYNLKTRQFDRRPIAAGPQKQLLEKFLPREKGGVSIDVITTGKPVLSSNAMGYSYARKDDPIKSFACLPLQTSSGILGTLYIRFDDEWHNFSADENEKQVLELFADRAATIVQKAQLYEVLQRKNKHLLSAYTVSQLLASGIQMNEQEILNLIHAQVQPLMDTQNMYIALYDEKADEVSFPLMYIDGRFAKVSSRRGGAGRTEWIIQNQRSVFIETRAESVVWYGQFGHEYIGEPFASWVGVPMIAGGKVLGVIATYHKTQDYVYTRDDEDVLALIANEAAIVLQNARMWGAMQQLSEVLSAGALLE